VYIYNHLDNVFKDPNLTIECLWRTIKHSEQKLLKLPSTLYLQFDNSGRENRNTQVRSFFFIFFFSINLIEFEYLGFYFSVLVG
jgi:hypothetical protein